MSSDLYVLEWSKKQNAIHIQPFEKTMSTNRTAYRDDQPVGDFVPLAIGSINDMQTAADLIRPTMEKRDRDRASFPEFAA